MAKSDYLKAYRRGKAARENAQKKGIVTTQARKPKKKKKKENPAPKQQSAPQRSTHTVSSSHGSSRGNQRRAGAHRAQQVVQKKVQQATQTTRTQGGVYKASKPKSNAPSKTTVTTKVTPVNAHRAGAQRARTAVSTAIKKAEDKSKKASVTAYKKHEANPTNALGTSVKVRTLKYGDAKKHKQKETEYKNKADDSLRREIAFRLKNEGYEGSYSDAFQRAYKKAKNKQANKVSKEAKKYADDAVGRVGTLKSEDLTSEDYLRMQTAGRMGGGDIGNKALGKKLSEKIGSRTAYSSGKNKVSKAATGVIQGFALADVLEGGVGTYNKNARGVLKDVKESTEYNVGYGVGQMASVAASPTTAAGKALAKGVFKGAAKSTARKLAENAAMDVVAETPMNIADAVKMARDENGKVDRKQLATFLALNTALTGGAGAGMEALGVAATKRSVKKIANLKAKIDNGTATLKDVDDYHASLDKLKTAAEDTQAAKSGFAAQEYDKAYGTTRLSRGEGVELARLNAKKNSANGLTTEQQTRLTELTNKAADIAGENEAIIAKAKESLDTKTAALNTLSKTTGVKYRALNNDELIKTLRENGEDIDDNAFVNGVNFVDKDGNRQILINKDSAQAHYTIVGHETTHLLEGSKEYDTLKSAVREFAESNNEYKELEEQMAKLYKNQTKGMSKEEAEAFLEEELTAEFVGRYLFREEVAEDFIRHLANKDRNLIQKIYDYLANALKNPSSEVEREQLQTMMKRFDDAFDDMGMSKGARFQLSENKQTLHAGKNSANDFLTNSSYSPYPQYKKLMKAADNGDEKSAELLAKKTGWYKENGKWQFDIDIKNMSFKNGIKSLAKKGEFGGTLNEEIGGIDHLFQNYPDVGYAGIGFGDTGGAPYTLNIGNKNKSLYGIVLNADLVKGKKDNMKINDTLSDALQDILHKIEDGKIARTAEEDYAEELFDVEGYTKLVSQNKKPVLKQKQAAKKAVKKPAPKAKQETTFNTTIKSESYEKYKKVFTEKFDSASSGERVKIMKSFGFRAQDGDVAANLDAASEEFKRVMLENGNPNPIKKTVAKETVDTPMSYNEGVDYIMKDANVSKADANRFKMAVEEYTRSEDSMNIIKDVDDWDDTKGTFDDTEHVNELINDINEYVEKSSALELKDGEVICRGIHLPEDEFKGLVDLLKNKMKVGDVFSAEMHPKPGTIGVPSSWSWVRKKAEGFAMWTYDRAYSVLGIQHNNITGTPVEHITSIDGEYEVLFGTKCDRTLMGWELVKDNKLIIHVMERAADSAPPKAKYSLAEMSGGDTSKLWLHNNPNQVDGKPVVENGKVTKEASTAYDKAVKSGDMKTAQSYVDAVLASKGYTYDAYHGSQTFGFTKFDPKTAGEIGAHYSHGTSDNEIIIFAAKNKRTAATYAETPEVKPIHSERERTNLINDVLEITRKHGIMSDSKVYDGADGQDLMKYITGADTRPEIIPPEDLDRLIDYAKRLDAYDDELAGIYHAKLKMDNPLVVDTNNAKQFSIPFKELGSGEYSTNDIAIWARGEGYDGVVFKNLHDSMGMGGADDIYAIFKSEQFKSADPVTYKDDGSVIPLSERGTAKEPDIRFSLGDNGMSQRDALVHKMDNIQKLYNDGKIDAETYVNRTRAVKKQIDAIDAATPAKQTANKPPVKETNGAEPKPAEPTAGETTRAEPTNGDAYTRPLNVQGIIERTRRAKTADPKFINESAKRSMKEMEEKYGGSEEFNALITGYTESGKVGKYRMKKKEQAFADAKQEFDDLGYEDMTKQYFMADWNEDPNLMQARERVLCNAIDRMEAEGEMPPNVAASEKMNIVMKDSSATTWAGNVLQAKKQWLTSTEQGRMLVVQKEIEQLEKRYKARIKGGKLIVDEEKLKELANATGWRKDELLNEINEEIWNQIPASLMERLNEYRHCFMLFNARTHGRNVFGNTVFRFARMVSDDMERAILNSKAARTKIGKMSGKEPTDVIINKQKVSFKEVKDNKMYLYNEFRDIYDKSGSRNKFIEMGRPDGVPTVKFKAMQKLIDLNYSALEKEDLKGALIPAFNKAYLGYCKARCPEGKELRKFMEGMTPSQKEKARAYALWEGEYATFRDSCAFSDWLTGAKQTFAGKKANTVWGTMGYRALDAVLEGALPFVKTPVNIFRRSMDYSPASLAKSIFVDLPTAKTVDEFQAGVHNLCTGLTGTAMMGVGVLLAQHGLVTVKAGEESGDAYYDRDMGFQDYSLKIPMDGKEYSWTLDWLSPMGMSLFAGASFQKMFDKDEFDNTAALNAFFACTSPITDMSFMSSPKDTVQRFMENASRGTSDGKETDFAGALAQLIVGDMPKNYVSGFFPQLTAQMAGFIDPYQRDTKSTKENVYLKGWQSSARQLASRTMTVRALSKYADKHPELKDNPILKNLILNPKINRRGEDVKGAPEVSVKGKDVTIAVKLVNTFLNPANVKEINEDDTDRELINIRNHIEDKSSNDYKFFYYNFTGNPSYDLADGKRMTYKDAYTYGKANRIEQNERIKDMLDSKSYKGMTWKMKADEVDDAHWIGTTVADLKTYNPNYAMKAMLKNNEKEKEAVKEYKRLRGETGTKVNKDYLEYYIEKERLVSRSHATGDDIYRMKGIAAVQKGDDTLLRALDIQKGKVDDIKHYWEKAKKKFGKDVVKKSFEEITDGCCSIMSNCKYAEVQNPSKGVKSVSAGMVAKGYTTPDGVKIEGDQIREDVYRLLGHNWNSAQAGGGLMLKYNKDGKYSIEKIVEMKSTLRNQFDENESGSINKQEVIDYIDSLGIDSDDEKACLYEVLYSGGNYKNPYKAQIDDHLKWGENRDDEWGDGTGSGGWGRRGRRRGGWGHGGGGGGGGGGTPFTPVVNTAGGAAKQTITKVKVSDTTKPSDYTKPSNLNDAYRKKAKKLRASTTTRRS